MTDLAADGPVLLSPTEARSLTDQIRRTLEDVWELVRRAYASRAWEALDYVSWDAYCTAEFGEVRSTKIGRDERSGVVASMRKVGMSNRAISSATGLSEPTVRRSGASSDAPVAITGTDGKHYTVNGLPIGVAAGAPANSPGKRSGKNSPELTEQAQRAVNMLEGVLMGLQEMPLDGWPLDERRKLAAVVRKIAKITAL
ncbi:hypothetical protein [Streptomyces sp. cg40]|uniref:hypothetical protein n=1 Tax=Streptomyces sp. cg40 TaxID=3419764 RepID=UPI003CFC253E